MAIALWISAVDAVDLNGHFECGRLIVVHRCHAAERIESAIDIAGLEMTGFEDHRRMDWIDLPRFGGECRDDEHEGKQSCCRKSEATLRHDRELLPKS